LPWVVMSNPVETVGDPFGAWPSPLHATHLAQASVSLGSTAVDAGRLFWVEGRPSEGGRSVLMGCTLAGAEADHAVREWLPARFNVRSRVHEYGGRAYAVRGERVVFCHDADQRLYLQQGEAAPRALTLAGCRYADFAFSCDGRWLYAVREDHRAGGEPTNMLVALDLDAPDEQDGRVLYGDADFVAAPAVSDDGRLAWIAWSHPAMPWDGTRLYVARIDGDALNDVQQIAGADDEAVMQPLWAAVGSLLFLSDADGYWNLCAWQAAQGVRAVTRLDGDLGGPLWQLGMRSVALAGTGRALAILTRNAVDTLVAVDLATGATDELLGAPYVAFASLAAVDAQRAFVWAARSDALPALVTVDLSSRDLRSVRTVRAAAPAPMPPAYVSAPEAIVFPTAPGSDGGARSAHAFFHRPCNPAARIAPGARPPLMVLLHGGPTGHASAELKLPVQFWTTRGFAVVNVNYGGSSGFGRAYRERLRGQWGVVDLQDAVAAVDFLAARGDIDPQRVVIRGGSAGGYTVLAALAFTRRFAAGINYYGVADLEALATDTHKFESRYCDGLIAPLSDGAAARAIYRARSPIHHLAQLDAALITFQGSEDRAVPPQQSRAITAAVRARGRPVAYLEFEGEQHGFRQAQNIARALDAEQYFLGRIFGFTPADPVAPVPIDNL
jgi:dipeptidyl aminopeptidase/acylaminoacyl peptidase